jgi:hypothetical protein
MCRFRGNVLPKVLLLAVLLAVSGCTEESRNKWSREADNLLGVNLKVSYVDNGQVVKSWSVKDGKITTGKDDQGHVSGYYYFWTDQSAYVQLPIERTIIEEVTK